MILKPVTVGKLVVTNLTGDLHPPLCKGDILEIDKTDGKPRSRACIAAHHQVATGQVVKQEGRLLLFLSQQEEHASIFSLGIGLLQPKAGRVLPVGHHAVGSRIAQVVGTRRVAAPHLGTETIRQAARGVHCVPQCCLHQRRLGLRERSATIGRHVMRCEIATAGIGSERCLIIELHLRLCGKSRKQGQCRIASSEVFSHIIRYSFYMFGYVGSFSRR